ncbi:hypothetical protein GQX73_g10018 [Xylaria multiplex]|uniref:Cytochrome P450 monooxygenase n=1 Tax=Xylaria multiplex TaxID=323545 RepID=A0A7C8ILQ8_9PEZI|nr:hypothetical protein GQX73_g10018 [Xylaria multiplex]
MNETYPFNFGFPSLEEGWSPRDLIIVHSVLYLVGFISVMSTAYAWSISNASLKKLPCVNPPNFFSNAQAKRQFRDSAKDMLQKARKQYPNRPYRMTTDYGEVVVLQSEWFDEIRNNPHLSFLGTVAQERICEIPGFEPLAALGEEGVLVQIIARKQLTKLLNQVTAPLSEEIALAVSINLGESTVWREIKSLPALRDITARMSSRVFVGDELARNEEWLRILKNYTVDAFKAINRLTKYPVNLRPYIGWLFPECRRIRDYYKRAREVIDPILEKRDRMKQAALASGQPAPVFNDALEWIIQESEERNSGYDTATFQMIVSTVAINTTTDLLQAVLIDLIQHPDAMQAVRDEIVQILKTDGWKKSSLYNMKLLDSALKETQRINPVFTAMRRSVDMDTVLSDGTVVKKGSRIHIDTHRMVDPEVYENPEEWKCDRFSEMRSQPGKEHLAQLVTTSIDHFGFGHGQHACPGRFFAANELKIALCHLLIKYDWKLAPGTPLDMVRLGFSRVVNTETKLFCRRREKVELDIDSI